MLLPAGKFFGAAFQINEEEVCLSVADAGYMIRLIVKSTGKIK